MKFNVPTFLTRLLLPALFATIGVVVQAQQQTPKPSPTPPTAGEQDGQREEIFIRRVRLPITVTDKKGQFVPGLTQSDFVVFEDKVPQQIETFSDDLGQSLPVFVAVLKSGHDRLTVRVRTGRKTESVRAFRSKY